MPEYIQRTGQTATEKRLFAYMVGRARLRDRLYFASDTTAARALGVSRRTIIRARLQLESDGFIVREQRRIGRAVVYSFQPHLRRKPHVQRRRVTQRSTSRSTSVLGYAVLFAPRYARYFEHCYTQDGGRGAVMRGELELFTDDQLPERLEPSARDLVSAVVDAMKANDIPLTRRTRGMIAKQTKELLIDGFTADVILTASVVSIRRGAPGHMHLIAQDIVIVQAGQRITRREYENQLNAAQKLLDPAHIAHRERLQRILGGGGDVGV